MFPLNQISLSRRSTYGILRKKKKRESGGREGEYRNHETWNLRQAKRLDKKQCNRKRVSGLDQDQLVNQVKERLGLGGG